MARYIDFDKIFPNGVFYVNIGDPEKSINEIINRINDLPFEDVVPKSEVERLEGELIVERTRRENAVDAYHEARQKIAREIFEEIEELKWIPFESAHYVVGYDDIAELKKKYTENENG